MEGFIEFGFQYVQKCGSNKEICGTLVLGVSSIINSLFNRSVLINVFFDFPLVVLITQMLVTIFAMRMARRLNYIQFKSYSLQRGSRMFAPSLLYSIINYIILDSVDGNSLPLLMSIFRFLPVVVVIFDMWKKRGSSRSVKNMTFLITLCFSASIVSLYGSKIETSAIFIGIATLIAGGWTFVSIERFSEQTENAFDLIYVNAINCFLLTLVADIVNDEFYEAYLFLTKLFTPVFVVSFIILIAAGAIFHSAVVFCILKTNAFHTAVVINLSSTVQIVVAQIVSIYMFYNESPGLLICACVWANIGLTLWYYKTSDMKTFTTKNKNMQLNLG